ncbi:MAG TPA: L,D-transpeptidase family protein [Alphaproteobacteria bacterium]
MVIRILAFLVLVGLSFAPQCSYAGNYDAAFGAMHDFYAAREFKPVWTKGDQFTDDAKALPSILSMSRAHGLDPQTYGVDRMQTMLTTEAPKDQSGWQQAEILWTYNLWRYASDLLGQKLDAATLGSVIQGDIEDNLADLAPDTPLYKAMQTRLAQIDSQETANAEAAKTGQVVPAPEMINFKRTFKPGMSSPAVPLLRARMLEYGAVPVAVDATPDVANLYDEALVKAVQAFQVEYGLKNDGAIGGVTLGILNRSAAEERRQLVANLQRLREPHRRAREDRRIEVSIARFLLTAYNDNQPALSMPVVVGQPKRQTISFRTEITGVRLNPTWTVPKTIRNEDFIPQLTKDPAKLVRRHGLKFTKGGKSFDPTMIDWTQVTPQEMAQVSMWTPAGEGNPLGFYRVIMDNPYDIYLHDTNHRDLFAGSFRALSSGCVRVGNPEELTNFILQGTEGWDPQKTKDFVKKGQTKDVVIASKIPIYLDYMTAWFNDRAQLVLGHDVYALDKPRYDNLVNNVLTTQRDAQKLLDQAANILQPNFKEARQDTVLNTTSN